MGALYARTTLNILLDQGAAIDWHADANPVSGLSFATTSADMVGGDLIFRDRDGGEARLVPTAGTLVCFDASVDHRVTMLRSPAVRLTVPMVYYASATEQPPAYGIDIYQ